MIIKSITHRSHRASIKNLLAYVFGDTNMENENGESVSISNLLYGKRHAWITQFERNEAKRRSKYGGKEVKFYHEILSFHPDSQPSKVQLEALVWKYLELRLKAPVLAFGAVHFSNHTHAHIIIAGTDCYGQSIRCSKREFKEIQARMNDVQMDMFPELKRSYIDYRKASQTPEKNLSHNAQKRSERTGERPRKERAHEIVEKLFVRSNSVEAFVANLAIENIEVYYRRNVLTGIKFEGQKMRLRKTLGIDFEQLLEPTLQEKRIARIRAMKESRTSDKNKER